MVRKPAAESTASHRAVPVDEQARDAAPLSRDQWLRQQIADQFGLSPGPALAETADRAPEARGSGVALSVECLDLLEAYIAIADPAERRRCLQAVRDAATLSPHRA